MLEAKQISFSYSEERTILDGVSISFQKNELVAVMGTSGSGKSTFLRILAGKIKAQSGEVKFDGKLLPNPEIVLVPGIEEIQYVAQDFDLSANRTVKENLNLSLLAYNDDFKDQQISWLLETLHLKDLAEKKIERLSGGEKQRLAIARALAVEPEVLMLDEPFTQLDLYHADILIKALQKIKQELETAIILVSHQPREIFQLADRLIILQQGKIVQEGMPLEIYRKPATIEVGRLFGPINKFRGEELYRPEQLKILEASVKNKKVLAAGKVIDYYFNSGSWNVRIKTTKNEEFTIQSLEKPDHLLDQAVSVIENE